MVTKKQDKDISDAAVKMESMQKKYDVEKEIKKKIFESLKCENYKFEENSKALQESTTILEKRLQDSLKETKNLKKLNEQESQNLKALEVSNASLEKSLKDSLKETKVLEAQIEKISDDLVILQASKINLEKGQEQSLLERNKNRKFEQRSHFEHQRSWKKREKLVKECRGPKFKIKNMSSKNYKLKLLYHNIILDCLDLFWRLIDNYVLFH